MEPPRSLITREFYKPRGAKHLRYTFTAIADALAPDNVSDPTIQNLFKHLHNVFVFGDELPAEYESSSMATVPEPADVQRCEHYLTDYGHRGVGQSYNAHFAVQDHLARNDPNFVAYEVPVWALPEETGNGAYWHGYIDYVALVPQGENKPPKILVADYKPNAAKEKHAHVQVYRYMLMLSRRSKIHISNFEGVYFDEKHAFQIFP